MSRIAVPSEEAEGLPDGIVAFTTTRAAGSFGLAGADAVGEVMGRWMLLRGALGAPQLASSPQVHGAIVLDHHGGWSGVLRADAADGHFTSARGLAMAVSVADCTPVFLAHETGAVAVLHAGWRGTAARIVDAGVARFVEKGMDPRDLHAHLGPSICGECYEVGPEVHLALTGAHVTRPSPVDVRAVLVSHLRTSGIERVSISSSCTRCNNDLFFSHRAGDTGRQIGVIFSVVE